MSHTHWDREWYHGVGYFAQRLVALVDALLALPAEDLKHAPFLLDGQAITLTDYLSRKPKSQNLLLAALRDGLIEAGPWYVLADNLIPSGEAIVRNLQAGGRVLGRFGASAPRVAYCPDTFGHPAALPMIACGFGLDVAVVWRGAGGSGHPPTDAFLWQSPDGSKVATCHLPPDGYEFGSALPTDIEGATQRWEGLRQIFEQRSRTGIALLLNGADHHARQPNLSRSIELLACAAGKEADGEVEIRSTSLSEWAASFRAAIADPQLSIPEVAGELRDSYGYTWTLGGTLATRAHQKRNNARLERLLLRDVEPWMALAVLNDKNKPAQQVSASGLITMAQLPELLATAWEDLLGTHPHDSLCGCSLDIVSRRLECVQESVQEQARGLRHAALQLVQQHDAVLARSRKPIASGGPILIRNRAARPRHGLAVITVRSAIADVAVGPSSASGTVVAKKPKMWLKQFGNLLIQPLDKPELVWERRESPQHYPDNDLVMRQRVLALVKEVPALGLLASHPDTIPTFVSALTPTPVRVKTKRGTFYLDNGLVSVAVSSKGRVTLRRGSRVISDALRIESSRDKGDSYTPSTNSPNRLAVSTVRLREEGPLRASVEITAAIGNRDTLNTPRGFVQVKMQLMISAESEAVQLALNVLNCRTDHQLRLVWRNDIANGEIVADAAFGPVTRVPISAPQFSRESVPDGMPLHRWLLHANEQNGAAILSDGLAEGFVHEQEMGVTLLRAIGQLSRASIPERSGHAGWPADIPDAQCLGRYKAKLALLLTEGATDDTASMLGRASDDLLLPLVGETWRDLDVSNVPRTIAGPCLTGQGLELSSVTLSQEDACTVVLRAVNCTEQSTQGKWILPDAGPWLVTPTRLDETPIGNSFECNETISFTVGARGTSTHTVRRVTNLQ